MSDRFEVGTGIVFDTSTGLEWEAEHHGPMMWEEAMKFASALRLGGHDDWRLPTLDELISVIDFDSKKRPSSPLPGMLPEFYWSSSPYPTNDSYILVGNFCLGSVVNYDKTRPAHFCCVRSK